VGRNVRQLTKEAGTAFAVLAIYVLTLLTPLHQAAGLQRDFDALGFATLDTWSVCGQLAQDGTTDPSPVVKCPAAGIGKTDLAMPVTGSPGLIEPTDVEAVRYASAAGLSPDTLPDHTGQSRAPPTPS
jgi:hypothetical protein